MGRDYTYVSDTVDGIRAAVSLECSFEVFNLGNSSPVTLNEMVAEIEKATGKRAKLKRMEVPAGDVPITYADLRKSESMLGYRPKVRFGEGIRRTVEWYRQWKIESEDSAADIWALADQCGQSAASVPVRKGCPK